MLKKLTGFTAIAGLFIAGSALAGIEGSAHDFSAINFASGGTNGEICVACHAPHENQNANGELLWNHDASSWAAGDYTVYDSPSLDGTASAPGAVSLLCLSCHDGTVAIDSYGGNSGTAFVDNAIFTNGAGAAGAPKFGQDLGNDHPIGLTYASGTGTNPIDAEMFGSDTSVTFADSSTGTIADDMLFSNVVECASCHDVHDTRSNGLDYLLVVSNANSDLCLTCHNK